MLSKFTDMERSSIIFTPLRLHQKSSTDPTKGKFTGKNKVGNTTCAKLHDVIGQKRHNSFR